MNNRKWSIVGFAGSLVLAGLAIVFPNSLSYAAALLVSALLVILGIVLWTVSENVPRVLTDPGRAKEAARSIYRQAARKGGTIHATHIFPRNKNPDEDFAIQELENAGGEVEVVFHRVLLLDSIEDERRWLTLLFDRLRPVTVKRFYTLSSYPLLLPRIAKALLPRLNLLLYQSPNGRTVQAFVGLDRLHLTGTSFNFALRSRNKRVYKVLHHYLDELTRSQHFRSCSSLQEYDENQLVSTAVQRGQAVVSRMVDFAESTRGVLFVGLFGSIARAALGVSEDVWADAAEADVDLLLVYDPRDLAGTEELLRKAVESKLDPQLARVTWGPDERVFYPIRDDQLIDVDIECFPLGSDFYRKNQLLGNSIFRFFMPLYSVNQRPVVDFVDVPVAPLTAQERRELVKNDRQGLAYFRARIQSSTSEADPRRLVTHVLRNVVWAITGSWPRNGKEAWNYLSNLTDWRESPQVAVAYQLFDKPTNSVRHHAAEFIRDVLGRIDYALDLELEDSASAS